MAPGPEVRGGPFESKRKIWETDFVEFEEAPGTEWVYVHWGRAVGPQLIGPTSKGTHHFKGPNFLRAPVFMQN